MIGWLTDENFNCEIVDGLLRRRPDADVVTARSRGPLGADDPAVLERAAGEGRMLLTHDQQTMPGFAYERLLANLPMPGVLIVPWELDVGRPLRSLSSSLALTGETTWRRRLAPFR